MFNVVVFAESVGDSEIVCGLADRVFEEVGNIPQSQLPNCRNWAGFDNTTFIEKSQITDLFNTFKKENKRPRFLGYGGGKGKGSYTAFWRKAVELVVAMSKRRSIGGVLIHCDADNKPDQRKDIEQACYPESTGLRFVLATPDREIEAWLLNGFEPKNSKEEKRLDEWKQKLRFDPCAEVERARAKDGDRDPKNILAALTENDPDRKRSCWFETSLSLLHERGERTGLTDFLKDVERHFLPSLPNSTA